MIRRFCVSAVLAASLLSSVPVVAAPVSFSFASVPLVDFAQFTFRDLLKRDYVLSSELIGLNKKITISVKALDDSKLVSFVESVLRSQGIRATERDGVFFLDSVGAAAGDPAPFVEKPADAPTAGRVAAGPGLDGGSAPAGDPVAVPELEFRVIHVGNRSAEFLALSVNAVAGGNAAKVAGGNRLVLAVPAARMAALVSLVEQLDVAADVVEVSASFVEVTTNESGASGLSLVNSALTSGSLSGGLSVLPGQGQIVVRGGRYELVLQALAADGRFKQVSNSRVVGDDAEKLLLSVGDETPTLGSSSTDNQGNQIQNVVYRPSGVILDVLPRVLPSGRLSLVVDGQVSAFQATTNGIANSPTLVKRQVKTSVSVADGEVLVIGGLSDSKATSAAAGFSFLPASWGNRSRQETKTDLVLILSARVLSASR